MRWPGFAGPSTQSQSVLASPARSVNCYPHRLPTDRYALYPSPGLRAFASAPTTPGRGIIATGGRCFAVIGPTLYEVFADGTTTSRGTVAVDQYPASLSTNGDGGDELFVISGDTGYILTLSTNVLTTEVSDVTMGGMMDGFFVALDINSSTLKISDSLDGTTWDGTQIAQRSTAPDPWQALLVRYPGIYLFGEDTSEVWYNAGTAPFPFAPVSGVQFPYGIAAPFSVGAVGSAVMWLARSRSGQGQVIEALGYTPTVVSTDAIEYAIKSYTRISDAVAYDYQEDGHEFYVLNFPSANATWVYDRTERAWHERGSWDDGVYTEFGPQYHAEAFGKHLVLHAGNGTIYEMTTASATGADGAVLRRLRIPPILEQEQRLLFLDRLQCHLEPGLGLVSGQGSTPQIQMRMSHDGGKTYGAERSRSAGVAGAFQTRVRWHTCGAGRNNVPELTMTDPVPWRLLDLYVDVRVGAA